MKTNQSIIKKSSFAFVVLITSFCSTAELSFNAKPLNISENAVNLEPSLNQDLKIYEFENYDDASSNYIQIYKYYMSNSYTLVEECSFSFCGNAVSLAKKIGSVIFISEKEKQRAAIFENEGVSQLIHLSSFENKSYLLLKKVSNKNYSNDLALAKNQLMTFYFDLNSFELNELAFEGVLKLANMANSKSQFFVTGHTDASGEYSSNIALSYKRALAVSKLLNSNGISQAQINVEAMAHLQPLTNKDSYKNRRVELKFSL